MTGINDSFKEANTIDIMEADTEVQLAMIQSVCTRIWLQRRLSGFIRWKSGMQFLKRISKGSKGISK